LDITLDNLFAFLVLLLMVVTFAAFIVPSVYLPFRTTREQQLEDVAQSVLDKLLFGMGYPTDWGKNITLTQKDLSSLGLHKDGGGIYELDMDKVLRIANAGISQLPATIQIASNSTSSLLGLTNPMGYEFSFTLSPALNTSVQVVASLTLKGQNTAPSVLGITVVDPDGRPASNANVTGLYLLMTVRKNGNNEAAYLNYTYCAGLASWEGKCTLNFTNWLTAVAKGIGASNLENSCAIVTIFGDYYGIRSPTSFSLSPALGATIVGRYLITSFPIGQLVPGTGSLQNVTALDVPPYYVYLDCLHNETNRQAGTIVNAGPQKYCVYSLGKNVDNDVTFVVLPVKYFGTPEFVVALRPPVNVISQTAIPGQAKTTVLRRLVRIGSWYYDAEVIVWRVVEY